MESTSRSERNVLIPGDLEDTLRALGLRLGRSSEDEVWACCPMHKKRTGKRDNHPTNFSVNRHTGDFNCFACGYRGDLNRLVSDVLGTADIFEVSRWLREHGASMRQVMERIGERRKHPTRNLKKRVVRIDEDTWNDFPPVPEKYLHERDISLAAGEFYDLRWDDGYLLPIKLPSGLVIGWQHKPADGSRPVNYPEHVNSHKTVFGAYEFEGTTAVVMESPLDVARLWTAGYDGGLATFGSSIRPEQERIVTHLATSVILAYDNDRAGWQTTKHLLKKFSDRVVKVLNYEHTDAKDIGEMTDEEIDYAIDNAIFGPRMGALE